MWNKIAGEFANSNTGSFYAWLAPLLIGIFTDPSGYLSAHPKLAATCAAVGLVGQGLYKLWTLYAKHSTPPAVVPADKPAGKVSQPSPHKQKGT